MDGEVYDYTLIPDGSNWSLPMGEQWEIDSWMYVSVKEYNNLVRKAGKYDKLKNLLEEIMNE